MRIFKYNSHYQLEYIIRSVAQMSTNMN